MNLRYKAYKVNQWIENRIIKSGYSNQVYYLDILLNIGIALIILLLSAPVFMILAIIIKLQDGGPIFYRGLRYGKNKKRFYMYKFRTLVPDAESIIGGKLLNAEMNLETPIGVFLRETRLDELPQLINVLQGDMVLIGPRPERPAIYEAMCKDIPDYDLRFAIKPGVIGFSQLFTPHGADKKIRTRIDNHYAKQRLNFLDSLLFISYTFGLLAILLVKKFLLILSKKISIFYKVNRFSDYRQYVRIKYMLSYQARVILDFHKVQEKGGILQLSKLTTFIFDLNEKYISVISEDTLPSLSAKDEAWAKIIIYSPMHLFDQRKRKHIISCRITQIELIQRRARSDSYRYLLAYEVDSKLNRYRLDKYVLNKSIL